MVVSEVIKLTCEFEPDFLTVLMLFIPQLLIGCTNELC